MKFTADLEIFGKDFEVECLIIDGTIESIKSGDSDYSDLLANPYVYAMLNKQWLDHLANLDS